MKSIFFILFLILSFSKASASQWNCWEEIDVTVCRHLQTGQIIRKSISPDGNITYRDNYGNIMQSYQDHLGATRYRDEHLQEVDPFASPITSDQPINTYQPSVKEKYWDNHR